MNGFWFEFLCSLPNVILNAHAFALLRVPSFFLRDPSCRRVCRLRSQKPERFFVFLAGPAQHVDRQRRRRRLLVPSLRFEPVADELLVERRWIGAHSILVARPETRGVRREGFVDQISLSGFVLAELALCVR